MQKKYASDYRMIAEHKCSRFSNKLALIYFIHSVIIGTLSSVTGVGGIIVGGPFILALTMITINVYNGKEPEIEDLFSGFKEDFGNSLIIYLLQEVFIFLWSCLLIIPGIVKACAYSMSFYVYNDNKNLSATDCLKVSEQIMFGHKMDYFCLMLSYIGWHLLSMLTCGILSFWIMPKIEVAKYAFYLNITAVQQENKQQVNAELI